MGFFGSTAFPLARTVAEWNMRQRERQAKEKYCAVCFSFYSGKPKKDLKQTPEHKNVRQPERCYSSGQKWS